MQENFFCKMTKKLKLAILCGGPSLERGISLNSARSVMDHLQHPELDITAIYFDHKKNPYHISTAQLYSNTPSDFDFKLQKTAKKLSPTALKTLLKTIDLAFPVMHGAFGEDGTIQRLLKRNNVPTVGSPAEACKRCFDKYDANEFIREKGFYAPPSTVLKIYAKDHKKIIDRFFHDHHITRAVVKPATGGSSIGVFSVNTPKQALEKVELLFSKRMDTRVVIEPFCEGTEFTVILLENRFGMPVAVLPTEIETDYQNHQVFDFRKKYLPTRQVTYHCPPRFNNATIERIQVQAEQLFAVLGMRDFARFDGWLLPDGNLWFSDFNPISGMEQNSFLFQQAARIGLSHRDVLQLILKNACRRTNLPEPTFAPPITPRKKKPVHVLFGGDTAERQVSLMSGTNVWLKLRDSEKYNPTPFLLDQDHNVWELPYSLTLNHTVEEITANCARAERDEKKLHALIEKVRWRLALPEKTFSTRFFSPEKMSLKQFITLSKKQNAFVFIGLHGGIGEDGTLQSLLAQNGLNFNGPDAACSRLCMDKFETIQALKGMEGQGIFTPQQRLATTASLLKKSPHELELFWKKLRKELNSTTPIVKPRSDGCSSGVAKLTTSQDLKNYLNYATRGSHPIPANTLSAQTGIIEMPTTALKELLFETFLQTDRIRMTGNRLKHLPHHHWIEVTVGVLEKNGKLRALSPSLTVASGNILSVEEKFQGGTGVNITPPTADIIPTALLTKAKKSIERIAQKIGIRGYSRIDTFLNTKTGDLCVIEVNTTPALTPSTVLFHQALAEPIPLSPRELLETLIENKLDESGAKAYTIHRS